MTTDREAKMFTTVFRGFDPAEVESALSALREATAAAKADTARIEARLNAAEAERDELRHRYADSQAKLDARDAIDQEAAQSVFVHLGKRIGSMLSLAEAEAASLRTAAGVEAAAIRDEAATEAEEVRKRAEQSAAEVRERAETEAEQTEFEAKQRAAAMLDEAIRDATARREEAEAYFERQRATAAAAAAEFERTLGERRDLAAQDFQAQMTAQEEALRRAQDRVMSLTTEGDRERQNAAEEANQRLAAAKQEAQDLLDSARAQAERIRRDSERELAAAMARRDSITSQLSNVRNMLATFGVSTAGVMAAEIEQLAESGQAPAGAPADHSATLVGGVPADDVPSSMFATDPGEPGAADAPGAHAGMDDLTSLEPLEAEDDDSDAVQVERVGEPVELEVDDADFEDLPEPGAELLDDDEPAAGPRPRGGRKSAAEEVTAG